MTEPADARIAARLARFSFTDAARAAELLTEPPLSWWNPTTNAPTSDEAAVAVAALARTADPDAALAALAQMAASPDARGLREALQLLPELRARLFGLLGVSAEIAAHLIAYPAHWEVLLDDLDLGGIPARLCAAIGAYSDDPVTGTCGAPASGTGPDAILALRTAYRREVVAIAGRDIAGDLDVQAVTETLADLAGHTLQAGLALAAIALPEGVAPCRLAVIAMGKTGSRELNYVSDVDVVFVGEPVRAEDDAGDGAADDSAIDAALRTATRLAAEMMRVCHSAAWEVDANLRPEGKDGPLVRTLASHEAYYQRWAKTWEFQALLKARHVAGDAAVGAAYLDAMSPRVWQASTREHFVEDVQAMRARVEQYVPASESERQLKLGPGGLRDVEFSTQLLQLVHGRTDDRLRDRSTLSAIDSLVQGGYVGRQAGHELDRCYRILRVLEHRIQLSRMRRTHLMPIDPEQLRPLGRALGVKGDPAEGVVMLWRTTARDVRRLYERLFFRPLLSAVARLSDDDACLSLDSAQDRFAALGYADPKGAIGHIQALTSGVSRRAAIQRTLLPVMLQWFAQEADPDLGLLAFRRISDRLGGTHWYLKMLRDEGGAAQLLARVLANSRYAGSLIEGAPSSVAFFGSSQARIPLKRGAILEVMRAAIERHDDGASAVRAIREIRRAELIRVAVADIAGSLDLNVLEISLTDIAA
ncbi:MAG: bifunctional [glutamine synthetase] adenylyltransferase/[glutamine synthetase]-adenylyl-L-tyrosine phosphorylase, partial [Jatrophihabitans sp.]